MKKYALFCLVMLVVALVGCNGGSKKATSSGKGSTKKSGGLANNDMFSFTIDNLNRLEEFQTEAAQDEIQRKIQELAQTNATARGGSTLLAAWPESESMRQIVDRLSQWIRVQQPPEWQRDPLVDELPEPLRKLPILAGLDKMEIGPFDGYCLQEAVYLRDVSLWTRGKSIDDRLRASRLFDWTIRNIQLEADSSERVPQFPWESLFFGRGTAWERAWVFVLLARQEGLEAAVLAIAQKADDAGGKESKPAAELRPWCVAVRIEGKAYLFDTAWGLPIPGPGGVTKGEYGELELAPASLDQLLADKSLLAAMNVDAEHPYPVKQADLKNVVVLVEGSPTALSRRMKAIESHLQGKQKMVLTTAASEQAARWKKLPGISRAGLWTLPYETIRRRSELKPMEIAQSLVKFMPFYAMPVALLHGERILAEASKTPDELQDIYKGSAAEEEDKNRPATDLMRDTESMKIKRQISALGKVTSTYTAPLYKGRVLQLKGQLSSETASAMHFYQMSRPSDEELGTIQEKLLREIVRSAVARGNNLNEDEQDKLVQNIIEAVVTGRAKDEAAERLAVEIQKNFLPVIEQQTALIIMGKMNASYWLGLISYERANYHSAYDYLGTRTMQAWPEGPWTTGAKYNLGRTLETGGEINQALKFYRAKDNAPDMAGQLLRAIWLEAVNEKKSAEKVDETKPEEPKADAAKSEEPSKEGEKTADVKNEDVKNEDGKIEEKAAEEKKAEEPKGEEKPVEEKPAGTGKGEEKKSGE